ncbi:hypothetical protein [Streptomyces misionensis]|uniref:hypothetical protein n=1 Tax=Streptomyces misionensis TaxID=67331 RepID=UPI003696EBD4
MSDQDGAGRLPTGEPGRRGDGGGAALVVQGVGGLVDHAPCRKPEPGPVVVAEAATADDAVARAAVGRTTLAPTVAERLMNRPRTPAPP